MHNTSPLSPSTCTADRHNQSLATTIPNAVIHPGTTVMTLVLQDEPLFADLAIRKEDVSFAQPDYIAASSSLPNRFGNTGGEQGEIERR